MSPPVKCVCLQAISPSAQVTSIWQPPMGVGVLKATPAIQWTSEACQFRRSREPYPK